jgi:hypothetical protein
VSDVAGDLRRELRDHVAALGEAERVELALRLGDADVALLRAVRGLDDAAARRLVAVQRSAGRRTSRCARGAA